MKVASAWSPAQGRVSAAAAAAGALARLAFDTLLPPRCLACGAPVAGGAGVCGRCWARLELISSPLCPRLGTPFAYDPGPDALSPAALADPPDFGRARAVARYEGPARELVHALKYRDRLEVASAMAVWMVRTGRELLDECDVVVPVPLHRRRLFARRFNQAALLAGRVAALAGVEHAPMALERVKPTRQQVGLSRSERRRNLAGAFRPDSRSVPELAGRRVVLVDDVLTTGATANACARACLRSGAAAVDVLVFARVVGEG